MKYSTTSQEVFSQFKQKDQKINAAFKYTRTDRFNPITGEKIGAPFGFEDYAPSTDKKYKANNLTVLPSASSKYDIINGRKLTYTWTFYNEMYLWNNIDVFKDYYNFLSLDENYFRSSKAWSVVWFIYFLK